MIENIATEPTMAGLQSENALLRAQIAQRDQQLVQKDQQIAQKDRQLVDCKRKGSEWYQRAIKAEKEKAEVEAILANKNLSASQALALYSGVRMADTAKKREDGFWYVSEETLSESIPIKDQAAGDALRALKDSGVVEIKKERKKTGPGFNLFMSIPTQTRLNLSSVVVDNTKYPRAGGSRIAIHKDNNCGGECIERTKYLCKKCGEDNISPNSVLLLNEETWRREQENIETEQTYLANRQAREEAEEQFPSDDFDEDLWTPRDVVEPMPDVVAARQFQSGCQIHKVPFEVVGTFAYNGQPRFGCPQCEADEASA